MIKNLNYHHVFCDQSETFKRLSAVSNVAETNAFQPLGIFETLGSKISLGTSKKVADVRTHLKKVSKVIIFLIKKLR